MVHVTHFPSNSTKNEMGVNYNEAVFRGVECYGNFKSKKFMCGAHDTFSI